MESKSLCYTEGMLRESGKYQPRDLSRQNDGKTDQEDLITKTKMSP